MTTNLPNYNPRTIIMMILMVLDQEVGYSISSKFEFFNQTKLFNYTKKIFGKTGTQSKGTFTKTLDELEGDKLVLKEHHVTRKATAYQLSDSGFISAQEAFESFDSEIEEKIRRFFKKYHLSKSDLISEDSEIDLFSVTYKDQTYFLPLPKLNNPYNHESSQFLSFKKKFGNELNVYYNKFLKNPWNKPLGIITGFTGSGKSSFINLVVYYNQYPKNYYFWFHKQPEIPNLLKSDNNPEFYVISYLESWDNLFESLEKEFNIPLLTTDSTKITDILFQFQKYLSDRNKHIIIILDQFEKLIENMKKNKQELYSFLGLDGQIEHCDNIAIIVVYRQEYQLDLKEFIEETEISYNQWKLDHFIFDLPNLNVNDYDLCFEILEHAPDQIKISSEGNAPLLTVIFDKSVKNIIKTAIGPNRNNKLNGIEIQLILTSLITKNQELIRKNLLHIRTNDVSLSDLEEIISSWIHEKLKNRIDAKSHQEVNYWEGRILRLVYRKHKGEARQTISLREVKSDIVSEFEKNQIQLSFEPLLLNLVKDNILSIQNDLESIFFSSDWVLEKLTTTLPEIDRKLEKLQEIFHHRLDYDEVIPPEDLHNIFSNSNYLETLLLENNRIITLNMINFIDKLNLKDYNFSESILNEFGYNFAELLEESFPERFGRFNEILVKFFNNNKMSKFIKKELKQLQGFMEKQIVHNFHSIQEEDIVQFLKIQSKFSLEMELEFHQINPRVPNKILKLLELLPLHSIRKFIVLEDQTSFIDSETDLTKFYAWLDRTAQLHHDFIQKAENLKKIHPNIEKAKFIAEFIPWENFLNKYTALEDLESFFKHITLRSNIQLSNVKRIRNISWDSIFQYKFSENPHKTLLLLDDNNYYPIASYWSLSKDNIFIWLSNILKLNRFDYFLEFIIHFIKRYLNNSEKRFYLLHQFLKSDEISSKSLEPLFNDAYNHEISIFKIWLENYLNPADKQNFIEKLDQRIFPVFNRSVINRIILLLESIGILLNDKTIENLLTEPIFHINYSPYYSNESKLRDLVTILDFIILWDLQKEKIQLELVKESLLNHSDEWYQLTRFSFYEGNNYRFANNQLLPYYNLQKNSPKTLFELYMSWINSLFQFMKEIDPDKQIIHIFLETIRIEEILHFMFENKCIGMGWGRIRDKTVEYNLIHHYAMEKFNRYTESELNDRISKQPTLRREYDAVYFFGNIIEFYPDVIKKIDYQELSLDYLINKENIYSLLHYNTMGKKLLKKILTFVPFILRKESPNQENIIDLFAIQLIYEISKLNHINLSQHGFYKLPIFLKSLNLYTSSAKKVPFIEDCINQINWQFELENRKFSFEEFISFINVLKKEFSNDHLINLFFKKITTYMIPNVINHFKKTKKMFHSLSELFLSLARSSFGYEEDIAYRLNFGKELFKSSNLDFLMISEILEEKQLFSEAEVYFLHNLELINPEYFNHPFKENIINNILDMLYEEFDNFKIVFFPLEVDHFQTTFSQNIIQVFNWHKVAWQVKSFTVKQLIELYHIFDEFQGQFIENFLISGIKDELVLYIPQNDYSDENPFYILRQIYYRIPALQGFIQEILPRFNWKVIIESEYLENSRFLHYYSTNQMIDDDVLLSILELPEIRTIDWFKLFENADYNFHLIQDLKPIAQQLPDIIFENPSIKKIPWIDLLAEEVLQPYGNSNERLQTILEFLDMGKQYPLITPILQSNEIRNLDWEFYQTQIQKTTNQTIDYSVIFQLLERLNIWKT